MTIANEPAVTTQAGSPERYYNYAYLDEQTKRMIRRAILKALCIPGYQVPFGSREMPVPYGWGTGGIQLTASIIGPDDVFKCIDQEQTTPPTRSPSAGSSQLLQMWQQRRTRLKRPSSSRGTAYRSTS